MGIAKCPKHGLKGIALYCSHLSQVMESEQRATWTLVGDQYVKYWLCASCVQRLIAEPYLGDAEQFPNDQPITGWCGDCFDEWHAKGLSFSGPLLPLYELVGHRLDDLRQTPWEYGVELLPGIGSTRYCQIAIITQGRTFSLTDDQISPWSGKSALIPITADGHDLNGHSPDAVIGRMVTGIHLDEHQELWLLLSGDLRLGFRICHGSGLVLLTGLPAM